MVPTEPWAKGSHEYAQRARPGRHAPAAEAPSPIPEESRRNLADCAVTWDDRRVDLDRIRPSETTRARARFRSQLPVLIWNDAVLRTPEMGAIVRLGQGCLMA